MTFFSWAALGYSFKFVWAPLVDKVPLPLLTVWLGRRRAWILLSQIAVILSILLMASTDPQTNLVLTAVAACALGFSSATQDIVIDAYRIESADAELQAMMASSYIAGYRIGMLVAGAGTLFLAAMIGGEDVYAYTAWFWAYACMAAAMGVGVVTTLVIDEPEVSGHPTRRSTTVPPWSASWSCSCAPPPPSSALRFDGRLGAVGQGAADGALGIATRLVGFLVETVRLAVAVGLAAAWPGGWPRLAWCRALWSGRAMLNPSRILSGATESSPC